MNESILSYIQLDFLPSIPDFIFLTASSDWDDLTYGFGLFVALAMITYGSMGVINMIEDYQKRKKAEADAEKRRAEVEEQNRSRELPYQDHN